MPKKVVYFIVAASLFASAVILMFVLRAVLLTDETPEESRTVMTFITYGVPFLDIVIAAFFVYKGITMENE
ncbi:MAG: hypothetical protein NUW37_05820 [Planctomycetes bacterium]|nr:hypothetical protein [Planctomycetota bacterium]